MIQLDDRQYCQEMALANAELVLAEAQLERLINGAHPQQRNEAAAFCRAREAELQGAETTWQRIQGLLNQRAVSQQEADNHWTQVTRLRNDVEAAQARLAFLAANARNDDVRIEQAHVSAAQARLALAKVQAERTHSAPLCAPKCSRSTERSANWPAPPRRNPPWFWPIPAAYYVRAFVEELDAPRVNLGMTAKVVIDGLRSRDLRGRVARLSPRMEPKSLWSDRPTERYDTKTREIWIELEPTKGLVLGLRVEVTIDARSTPGASCSGRFRSSTTSSRCSLMAASSFASVWSAGPN